MQVMMVGDTQSGKTTFMAGMYKCLAEADWYSIIQRNATYRRTLDKIAKDLEQGKYPDATDIHETFKFGFYYEDEWLFDFEWYDYRGGALRQYSQDSPDVKELDRKLESCDAMIVFIDSTTLNDHVWRTRWRCIEQIVWSFVAKAKEDHILLLSIVFTKIDLVTDDISKTDVGKKCMNMIGGISQNQYLSGLLGFSAISNNNVSIAVPFIFLQSMRFHLIKEIKNKGKQLNTEIEAVKQRRRETTTFQDIWTILTGEEPSNVQSALGSAQSHYDQLLKLEEHHKILCKTFEENNGFDKGGYMLF